MDLIKQMIERRKQLGILEETSDATKKGKNAPKPIDMNGRRPTLKEMRSDIIQRKPKAKIVKKYFEEVISRMTADSSDDEI